MSFILDALKKSESERQRADTPALYEMKMAPPRSGVATWLIALAVLLVINVVVLSVVLLRGTRSAAPQMEATNPVPPPPPAAAAPASVPPPSPTPMTSVPPTAPSAGAQSPDNATDDDAPAVDAPRTVAGAAPRGSGADSGDVPTYEQAAGAPGADLPELKLDLHAYASNPPDRFIFLNMLNLKEGQTSPAGVRVEAITPDGAILSWRGAKFFLHSQ